MRYGDTMFGLHPDLTYFEPNIIRYLPLAGASPLPVRSNFDVNLYGWRGERPSIATGGIIGAEIPNWRIRGLQLARAASNAVVNPSVETDWANMSKSAALDIAARSYLEGKYGVYSTRMLEANSAGAGEYIQTADILGLAPATTYNAVGLVKKTAQSVAGTGILGIFWFDGGGAFISSSSTPLILGLSDWRYYSLVAVSPALTARARIIVASDGYPAASSYEFYVDALQFAQNVNPTLYLDGSLGAGHAWTGGTHASSSTRAAAALAYPTIGIPNLSKWSISCYLLTPIPILTITRLIWDFREGANISQPNLAIGIDGKIRFSSNAGTIIISDNPIASETLTHLVVTADYPHNRYELYINGVKKTNYIGAFPTPVLNTNHYIGSAFAGSETEAVVTDWAMFDKILTEREVNTIYGLGGPIGLYEDTLYWKDNAIWRPSYLSP